MRSGKAETRKKKHILHNTNPSKAPWKSDARARQLSKQLRDAEAAIRKKLLISLHLEFGWAKKLLYRWFLLHRPMITYPDKTVTCCFDFSTQTSRPVHSMREKLLKMLSSINTFYIKKSNNYLFIFPVKTMSPWSIESLNLID